MLRGRFVAKNNRAMLEVWSDAAAAWGKPQAARLAHLVAAELYRVHGDAAMLEVRKNARTGISRVVVHPVGFCALGSVDQIRITKAYVVAAARSAESIAKTSLRMDLSPAGSGTSGAQDQQVDPGDVEVDA